MCQIGTPRGSLMYTLGTVPRTRCAGGSPRLTQLIRLFPNHRSRAVRAGLLDRHQARLPWPGAGCGSDCDASAERPFSACPLYSIGAAAKASSKDGYGSDSATFVKLPQSATSGHPAGRPDLPDSGHLNGALRVRAPLRQWDGTRLLLALACDSCCAALAYHTRRISVLCRSRQRSLCAVSNSIALGFCVGPR